ncbi:MAG: ATP-binding protein [Aquificae bacterium]|nr:ATP-binding protein [Aquificota bacterium]
MDTLRELLSLLGKRLKREDYPDSFFENHLAFRLKGNTLEAVKHPSLPNPESLKNINRQKTVLFRNTEQFIRGLPANDVLLWGERGTGKSSLVKATLTAFHERGLRIIQVYKLDIMFLTDLYEVIRDRKQKFILFFDDLSFEPSDESFKLLKSILEGDVEERPNNLLVYATSNRRNIVAERELEEKFPSEGLQERVSLADRFGIRLGFFPFGQEEYLNVVLSALRSMGIEVEEEAVREEALRWATERGSFSGRTAVQFAKDYAGRLNLGL